MPLLPPVTSATSFMPPHQPIRRRNRKTDPAGEPYPGGMPELRELRYFRAVAEDLNITRAAERLGIAQPPLSRAIRQLERRLGVDLFDRTGHRLALTQAGEVLLKEAIAILGAV